MSAWWPDPRGVASLAGAFAEPLSPFLRKLLGGNSRPAVAVVSSDFGAFALAAGRAFPAGTVVAVVEDEDERALLSAAAAGTRLTVVPWAADSDAALPPEAAGPFDLVLLVNQALPSLAAPPALPALLPRMRPGGALVCLELDLAASMPPAAWLKEPIVAESRRALKPRATAAELARTVVGWLSDAGGPPEKPELLSLNLLRASSELRRSYAALLVRLHDRLAPNLVAAGKMDLPSSEEDYQRMVDAVDGGTPFGLQVLLAVVLRWPAAPEAETPDVVTPPAAPAVARSAPEPAATAHSALRGRTPPEGFTAGDASLPWTLPLPRDGELSEVPIGVLLGALKDAAFDGLLRITSWGVPGWLRFRDGAVVDGALGTTAGEMAVRNLLLYTDGRFEVVPQAAAPAATAEAPPLSAPPRESDAVAPEDFGPLVNDLAETLTPAEAEVEAELQRRQPEPAAAAPAAPEPFSEPSASVSVAPFAAADERLPEEPPAAEPIAPVGDEPPAELADLPGAEPPAAEPIVPLREEPPPEPAARPKAAPPAAEAIARFPEEPRPEPAPPAGSQPAPAPTAAEPILTGAQEVPDSGFLLDYPVGDLLAHAERTRRTGRVSIESFDITAYLEFTSGELSDVGFGNQRGDVALSRLKKLAEGEFRASWRAAAAPAQAESRSPAGPSGTAPSLPAEGMLDETSGERLLELLAAHGFSGELSIRQPGVSAQLKLSGGRVVEARSVSRLLESVVDDVRGMQQGFFELKAGDAAAAEAPPRSGTPEMPVRGDLRETGVVDLMHIAQVGGETGVLEIHAAGARGALHFKRGIEFHAEWGETKGISAIAMILKLKAGSFLWNPSAAVSARETLPRGYEEMLWS